MLPMLLLQLLQSLLLLLPLLLIQTLQVLAPLVLLQHLVAFELLMPLGVIVLQVFGGLDTVTWSRTRVRSPESGPGARDLGQEQTGSFLLWRSAAPGLWLQMCFDFEDPDVQTVSGGRRGPSAELHTNTITVREELSRAPCVDHWSLTLAPPTHPERWCCPVWP